MESLLRCQKGVWKSMATVRRSAVVKSTVVKPSLPRKVRAYLALSQARSASPERSMRALVLSTATVL